MIVYQVFTDGGFFENENKATWAFAVYKEDELIFSDCGVIDGEVNKIRNIAGELSAVMRGVLFCKKNGARAEIYHDLEGAFAWVADLFGGKAWKRNNEYTQKYHEFIIKNRDYIDKFVKVKGHSGDLRNDFVDELAKRAIKKQNKTH